MCNYNIKSIIQHLVTFGKQPKKIEGRVITEWFKTAESIFTELYKLGVSVKWNYSFIRNDSKVPELIDHFTKNQVWLQTFVNIYPTLRIDLLGASSAKDICMVRSGIEFLLKGFKNINKPFDKVLKDLEEQGEVDELDRCLKIWRNSGHRPDFGSDDKKLGFPDSHWWWD